MGRMKDKPRSMPSGDLFLYYKTEEDFRAYKRVPVRLKLAWLEAQMEFFHEAMPPKAKEIREKLRKGEL